MQGELLLISNSTNPGESYLEHCADGLQEHFEGCSQVVFVPYALADLDGYATLAEQTFGHLGIKMRSVHRAEDPAAALSDADGVFVGGGNTFRLLARVRGLGLLDRIREEVAAGMRYAGASAGSNLACPTIKTTNDMPIVDPGGLDALDLFPYQINPHYVDRDPDVAHGGETREQRLVEFHEEDPTPVIALYEGAMLHYAAGRTVLSGNGAVLFQRGRPRRDLGRGGAIEDEVDSPL